MPQPRRTQIRSRPHAAALTIVAGGVFGVASAPVFAIAEAITTLCRQITPGTLCPWYDGYGPVLNVVLPDPIILGSRSVVGVIDGLLPLATHEAFIDEFDESRIIVEIIGGLGYGNPDNQLDVNLRSRATGIIGAAIMDGQPSLPEPLAMGVAPRARGVVASVGLASGPNETYVLSQQGLIGSLFVMTDPGNANAFGLAPSEMPDVIVTALANIGDYTGDGIDARIHDAIASMYGITLIAPTGDGAQGPGGPDPDDPNQLFRTAGAPATSFNTMGVGAFTLTGAQQGNIIYDTIADFSGRGRIDARNYRSSQPNTPGGFEVVPNSRFSVEVVAPGEFLRLPLATGDGDYSRETEIPKKGGGGGGGGIPGPPDEGLGSKGTAFAAGLAAGTVALLQDAYKAIREINPINPDPFASPIDFSHFQNRTRLHNTVVRAMLVNSCTRSASLWTNVGNQGGMAAEIEPDTVQPLDTTEGGGIINFILLAQTFQGDPGDGFEVPVRYATMDVDITKHNRALFRDPAFSGGDGGSGNNLMAPPASRVPPPAPLFGGPDPDLTGWGTTPTPPPDFGGGYVPNPEIIPRPRPPFPPLPPNSDPPILFAIPINQIGWDHARLGPGFLDYEFRFPTSAGDRLTATLVWNRTQTYVVPNIASGGTINFITDERELELENLNLEVWLSNSGGAITGDRIAASRSTWSTVEHVITPLIFQGRYIIRVRWQGRLYDRYQNLPGSDVEFGLAWRIDSTGMLTPGGLDPLPLLGDVNGDGVVDNADLQIVIGAFGSNNLEADLNNDGVVDFYDLQIVLNNFGATQ